MSKRNNIISGVELPANQLTSKSPPEVDDASLSNATLDRWMEAGVLMWYENENVYKALENACPEPRAWMQNSCRNLSNQLGCVPESLVSISQNQLS